MASIDIVSVVNNFEMYDRYFSNNPNVNKCNLIAYDNTQDNLPIPIRFNNYINNKMQNDSWSVFCHQDFEIKEDIGDVLLKLDKNSIHGPVGAGTKKQFVFFLRMDGLKLLKSRIGFVEKQEIIGHVFEDKSSQKKFAGRRAKNGEIVNTLDCCCFIAHSSLIKKLNYQFDEKLDWHLYSEDFSLFAKKKQSIETRIVNIESTHFSGGNFDESFKNSLDYLIKKYSTETIVTTCYDGAYQKFIDGL